jgi:phosphatidylserine/phosphatidylglycerophosphate/cardiolipin synthase-like enzyme
VLGAFLRGAKTQLLIYDPKISDPEMLGILHDRAKTGVEIKIIGTVAGRGGFDVQKLGGTRLHTRTIIRDRRQAFIGSQSLRRAELDSRREVGLIVRDAKVVKKLIDTFEGDWTSTSPRKALAAHKDAAHKDNETDSPKLQRAAAPETVVVSDKEAQRAVQILTKELDPLAVSVKKAVKVAVAKVGDAVLGDKDVKDTMKKVVKKAVKDAVKEAVKEAVSDT